METCRKLFENYFRLVAAHEYFPACSLRLNNFISLLDVVTCEIKH